MKTSKFTLILMMIMSVFALRAQTPLQPEGVSIKKNSSPPHATAMLDVEALDKGVLIPRVVLTSTGIAAPVGNNNTPPANGLMVFNTTTVVQNGLTGQGFYYWHQPGQANLGKWVKLSGSGNGGFGGSDIPKVTFAQMKAMTSNMNDNDLGAMVFVTDIDTKQLAAGKNIANPDFWNGFTQNNVPINTYNVFGLWYLSKVKLCPNNATLTPNQGLTWKYLSNTGQGEAVGTTSISVVEQSGCVNNN